VFIADPYTPSIRCQIARLKLVVDLIFIEPKLRQPLPGDFEKDLFLLLREQVYFLDTTHQKQLAAQELYVPPKFGLSISIAGNR
jgi:hypothetical protein